MASFEGIKVGDEVVILPGNRRYWPRYVATVLRVTPTQFKVSRYTFRKKDGRCVGDYGVHVYQATPELLAEIRAEQRFINTHENLVKLRNQLETVTREIHRTHDKHQLDEAAAGGAVMASFEGIKVDDEVVIDPPNSRMSNSPRYVAKVEHVTRTEFVAGGYRFRKDSGSHIGGDGWYSAHVYHLTPELLAAVEMERRYYKAHENLVKLRHRLETVTREIDRTHDKHQLAEAMEAAATDVAAAVAKLQEAIP